MCIVTVTMKESDHYEGVLLEVINHNVAVILEYMKCE